VSILSYEPPRVPASVFGWPDGHSVDCLLQAEEGDEYEY
jgi:hypothetical protein